MHLKQENYGESSNICKTLNINLRFHRNEITSILNNLEVHGTPSSGREGGWVEVGDVVQATYLPTLFLPLSFLYLSFYSSPFFQPDDSVDQILKKCYDVNVYLKRSVPI